MKSLYWLQSLVLLGGATFAWVTVAQESATTNPLATMCFYGAIGFTIAFIWSIYTLISQIAKWQKYLTWFLGLGTIFAGGNFAYLIYKFYYTEESCSACLANATTPWQSSCFYGTLLFLTALIIAIVITRMQKKLD